MARKFQVYKDKKGEFRWRYKANNGRIIFCSSEGYKSKTTCLSSLRDAKNSTWMKIEDLTDA